MNKKIKRRFNDNRGVLSIEFLFGIVVTFLIMVFLLRVSYSLMMVEVAQYIAFSTARAHAASDVYIGEQRANGMKKYKTLKENPLWRNHFEGAFEMAKANDFTILKSGENYGSFDEYLSSSSPGNGAGPSTSGIPFIGVKIPMKLTWLNIKIPLLGSTAAADEEFQTNITGFILREPSMQECQEFMLKRYVKIIQDDTNFSKASSKVNEYVPMEDNGC